MNTIKVNFNESVGPVRPMHSVNNGPYCSRGEGTEALFREAQFPYARTHDSSFCAAYGGEHTVDVHRIFRNFDADENDPANYDFTLTDKYMADINSVGTKVFYRLGASIEHEIKKYGTQVPKDFLKWAKICEHIMRHYTEGWADGFFYDIEYWEVWNEPDCRNANGSNPCWQGNDEQFADFFATVVKYLKEQFPDKKIGGPAMCVPWSDTWDVVLPVLKERGIEPDFYSYHCYSADPKSFTLSTTSVEGILEKYGMKRPELILNEWNYIRGWLGDDMKYSYMNMITNKGASFCFAAMLESHEKTDVDHLMYYDARPSLWSGLYDQRAKEPYPPYYAFLIFHKLYELGTRVKSESSDETIYYTAAKNGEKQAVALTWYVDDDGTESPTVALELTGVKGKFVDTYVNSQNHPLAITKTERINGDTLKLFVTLKKFDQVYLEIHE